MKLSIITINRNNANGLRRTIESVLNQTFSDFEYIVIDGASTDDSVAVIKEFESKIYQWVSEPDGGIYNAMNKGISKARGEYCLFLNSGDYLSNNSVLNDVFSPEIKEDIVYGSIKFCNNSFKAFPIPEELSLSYFYHNSLPHPCSFIRRELFTHIGLYKEEYKIISDWVFFVIAICKYNVTLRRVDEVISVYDLSGLSSDIGNDKLVNMEEKLFFETEFPRIYSDYKRLMSFESEIRFFRKFFILRLVFKITRKIINNLKLLRKNLKPSHSIK